MFIFQADFLFELGKRKECKWISSTKGNTVYGSEVVNRVFLGGGGSDSQADLLLAPMDSAAFAQQDFQRRGEEGWKWRCVGVEAMISLYQLSYTAQPLPRAGRVFSASVFYRSAKLAQETARPGNLTMPSVYQCPGCVEGMFVQHLVRSRGWSYERLALDGLRSVVFDGPSPTHCIAAGNVWLDHKCPQQVGCLTYKSIRQLQLRDSVGNATSYDWDRYQSSNQICLRLSMVGSDRAQC
jgi:hypothetical protein